MSASEALPVANVAMELALCRDEVHHFADFLACLLQVPATGRVFALTLGLEDVVDDIDPWEVRLNRSAAARLECVLIDNFSGVVEALTDFQ